MTVDLPPAVAEILRRSVAAGAMPGASFVLTERDGRPVEVSVGKLRADDGAPVTPSAMYRLMSMTKAFVSVGALQLIEEGRLRLDQAVASILPEFEELMVLEGFDGERPRLREPRGAATIKHLLTHTSGLGYNFHSPELVRYHELTGTPDWLSCRLASLTVPLIADPGGAWRYGTSTDWLGQVIERISGQDLSAYLTERLFGPLGMLDTTFAPSDEQRSRLMAVHARTPDGGLVLSDFDLPAVPEYFAGGHGAYGTARDYARFMAMLLSGGALDGARILRPESVEQMFNDGLDGAPMPNGSKTAMPRLTHDLPALPYAHTFGLGLHVFTEDLPGMRRAGSGDWSGLCNCYYWVDRGSGLAGALLTQVLPFHDTEVLEAVIRTELTIYDEILDPG
ncbi:MAG TPA: serine hydrolase domain-containing protein [Solirubrobacteraceae bacterium]|nr:serine hydrolase domain-containing protein [Solirubrobacteraceae bacterium]